MTSCGKLYRVSIWLILFVSTVLYSPGQMFAANRVALVIGNGRYVDSPLKNPVNDATDIAKSLNRMGFSVTLVTDADERKMKKAIRDFGQRSASADVRLFYYAGHGMQVRGANYT